MRGMGARDDAVLAHGAALHESVVQRGNRWAGRPSAVGGRCDASVLHHRRGERRARRVQRETLARLLAVSEVSVGGALPDEVRAAFAPGGWFAGEVRSVRSS